MSFPTTIHRLKVGLASDTKDNQKHKYDITKLHLIKPYVRVCYGKIKDLVDCLATKPHPPPNPSLTAFAIRRCHVNQKSVVSVSIY